MIPPTRQQAIVGCIAVLLLLSAAGIHTQRESADRGAFEGLSETSSARPAFSAGSLRRHTVIVDVAGAVRAPGVYELRDGARVLDAVRRAGGLLPEAEASAINRAAPLVDGQQVVVPLRAAPPAAPESSVTHGTSAAAPSASITSAAAPSVSINSADATALDALEGIGPVTAQKIVDDRSANGPFSSVDELDRVPGIGPATVEALRAQVTL